MCREANGFWFFNLLRSKIISKFWKIKLTRTHGLPNLLVPTALCACIRIRHQKGYMHSKRGMGSMCRGSSLAWTLKKKSSCPVYVYQLTTLDVNWWTFGTRLNPCDWMLVKRVTFKFVFFITRALAWWLTMNWRIQWDHIMTLRKIMQDMSEKLSRYLVIQTREMLNIVTSGAQREKKPDLTNRWKSLWCSLHQTLLPLSY